MGEGMVHCIGAWLSSDNKERSAGVSNLVVDDKTQVATG